MGCGKPDLGSERPDLGSERPDLRSERPILRSRRPDLGSERPNLESERGDDQNVPFSMSQHKMSLISNVPDQNVPLTNVPFNVPFFQIEPILPISVVTRHSSLN